MIDEKYVQELIKTNIESQIKHYDFQYVVQDIVEREMKTKIHEITDEMIKEQVKIVLDSEINTDNGWGKREHWDSFEDMFKDKFLEKLNSDWEIKRVIENTVRDRLNVLFQSKTKELTEKIQGMVLNEMIKE